MSGHFVIIKASGEVEIKPRETRPTLEEVQKAVDGYVQLMPLKQFGGRFKWHGELAQMLVNEDGRSKNLPPNKVATQLLRDFSELWGKDVLLGDVVLLTGTCRWGN